MRAKSQRNWRRRWLKVVKADRDWDGNYLLELINHKLHLMLDFYSSDEPMQVDESRLQIVKELKEVCELSDNILNDTYHAAADAVMDKHCQMKSVDDVLHVIWDTPQDKELHDKLFKQGDIDMEAAIEKFFFLLGKNYRNWWD